MQLMFLYRCFVCKIDRLYLLADVLWIVDHLAELCKEYHIDKPPLFPGPLGQCSISCALLVFVYAVIPI